MNGQGRYYVYVLRSLKDQQFYVGFTKNLPARVDAHNHGSVPSTRSRLPLELVYWEGCLSQTDATRREKYLKTAWGKRYIKTRLENYLTGKGVRTTMIYTDVLNRGGRGVLSPADKL